VQDIKTVILNEGRISADGISNIIDRSNAVVAFIHKYFPNAAGSSVITDKVQATLEELNICEDNLLYAQSVCPDEINHHREGCITTNFIDAIGSGKCFHLGGVSETTFAIHTFNNDTCSTFLTKFSLGVSYPQKARGYSLHWKDRVERFHSSYP